MNGLFDYILWNNTISQWLIALGIIAIAIIILRLLQSLIINRLVALTVKTKTTVDDFIVTIVRSSLMPLLYVLAFYFGLQYLSISVKAQKVLHVAIMVAVTFFVLRMISSFTAYLFRNSLLKKEENEQRRKQSKGILLIVQAIIWLLGVLFLVDNLGYDITTLIAGLGIGGIAIALAAQTILGDLFSYLVIFFDKPFEIGDFIIVEDKMGTIEYIGIKTTRIRTLGGEQLICSNSDLTNSRVHNYKRMNERRTAFSFGIVYNTPADKLADIPGLVKQSIDPLEEVRFDRAHFKSFGDFSLNFEVVYYVLTPDYNKYMDLQQEINLKLFALFEKAGIEFAFPTQTIFLSKISGNEKPELTKQSISNLEKHESP